MYSFKMAKGFILGWVMVQYLLLGRAAYECAWKTACTIKNGSDFCYCSLALKHVFMHSKDFHSLVSSHLTNHRAANLKIQFWLAHSSSVINHRPVLGKRCETGFTADRAAASSLKHFSQWPPNLLFFVSGRSLGKVARASVEIGPGSARVRRAE